MLRKLTVSERGHETGRGMKEYSPGVPAVDRGHKDDGAVIFLPVGPPHQMENLESSNPPKAIRVELKKDR